MLRLFKQAAKRMSSTSSSSSNNSSLLFEEHISQHHQGGFESDTLIPNHAQSKFLFATETPSRDTHTSLMSPDSLTHSLAHSLTPDSVGIGRNKIKLWNADSSNIDSSSGVNLRDLNNKRIAEAKNDKSEICFVSEGGGKGGQHHIVRA